MGAASLKRYRRVYFKENQPCMWCKRVMAFPNSVEANVDPGLVCTNEHTIYPQSKGGTNEHFNLDFACYRCNNLRGDINFYVFKKFAEVVLRKYPNLPTILLRNSLRQYTNSCLDYLAKNNQALNQASSLALLRLADESRDYKPDTEK